MSRFFMDGHSRIYVDSDDSCRNHHGKKDPPLYHVKRGIAHSAFVIRCPRSLSDQERSRLKEKP